MLLAWALVDWLRPLGRWPLVTSGVGVALTVAVAAWWLRRRARAHPPAERMARLVEEQCPELEATLRTALDPAVDGSPFASVVRDDAATALSRLDEARVIDPDDRRRAWLWAGGAVAAVLVAAGLATPTAVRAARTARFVVAPPQMALRVTPGDRRVVKGSTLTIAAAIDGAPAGLDVPIPQLIVEGDGARAVGALSRTPQGDYQVRIPAVDRSFTYRVRAGGLRTGTYRVEALDRPRILGIDLAYEYPSFSGLKPRQEADTGDIYAPAGSKVTVRVRSSKPLRAAQLRATDGDGARAMPLQVTGEKQGEVALTIARDGAYRIALTDTDAIDNGEETEYFIRVMDDRPPDVRVIRPAGDRGVTRLEEVALEARAEDDYGVQSLELVYAVRGGPEKVVPLGGNGQSTAVSGKHTVYLEDLDVKPGDFVSYYAMARRRAPAGSAAGAAAGGGRGDGAGCCATRETRHPQRDHPRDGGAQPVAQGRGRDPAPAVGPPAGRRGRRARPLRQRGPVGAVRPGVDAPADELRAAEQRRVATGRVEGRIGPGSDSRSGAPSG